MPSTIAIVNQKGGVGKTSLAVNLGHLLAGPHTPVLLIDLDAQGNVSEMLGQPSCSGLYQFLVEQKGSEAIRPTGRSGLHMIGSDHRTVEVKNVLQSRPFGELALKIALEDLGLQYYTVIILDLAPSIDVLQVAALTACTHYLIPVQLDHLSVTAAGRVLNSARSLLELGKLEAQFLGVVPTFWDRTTNESTVQLAGLVETYGILVWPPIPRDTRMREASAHGQTIIEYDKVARALVGIQIEERRMGGLWNVAHRMKREVLDAQTIN